MMEKRFRFSEARVKSVPTPAKGRTNYYDTDVPDLELRVTERGAKSFNAYCWSSKLNKPVRVYLGTWPTLSVEDARIQAKDKLSEIAHGVDPCKEKRLARQELTLGVAVETYIDSLRRAEKKRTTLAHYEYLNKRHLTGWHTRRLDSLTSDRILVLRAKVRDKDGTNAVPRTETRPEKANRTVTANQVMRLLSQTFNHAIRSGWKGSNPCTQIKPFPEKARTRRLEDHELGPFVEACEKLAGENDMLGEYLLVCLFSGVRRRNVAAARWEHIDLKAKVWNVPDTKNGLPIRVYLSGKLQETFERLYKRRSFSPFVFAAESAKGHIVEPRNGLARVIKKAGIDSAELTIHALKHTFISCAYECGLNPIVISRIGGHKVSGITARYGHTSDERVREAYEAVERYIVAAPQRVKAKAPQLKQAS